MFQCKCGGVFLVIEVEQYPDELNGLEKLEYQRKCTVKCDNCGDIQVSQPYD